MSAEPDTPKPAPRRARSLRPLLRFGGLLLVATVVATAGLAWRLTQGPLALPDWALDRLETRLNRDLGALRLSMPDLALAYDLDTAALRLHARDLALTRDGADLLRLPEARIGLDGAALLAGEIRPRAVDLDGLALDVTRDAQGQVNLAFGGGGAALPGTWAEGLAALDAALATPAIARLDRVDVSGITLHLEDAITGVVQDLRDGEVTLQRGTDRGADLSLRLDLPAGGARTARLALSLSRGEDGARAQVALLDLPLGYLAENLPRVRALSLVTGTASATAAVSVSEDGVPGALNGRVELTDPRLSDRPELALDRSVLAFGWVPGGDRIALTEIRASSDDLSLAAEGQILLEDGPTGPVQVQLRLGETVIDPEGLFDRRVAFDAGVIEARLTQAPMALHLGQAMLTGPSGTARLSGRLALTEDGPAGALALSVPRMAVDDLKALWPRGLRPQSRRWFVNNMIGGTASDVTGALRLRPGAVPEASGSFAYAGGQVRFMRFMPPAEDARGAAQFDNDRLAMRVDGARVPALGPGDTLTAETPRLSVTTANFVIPDATAQPARGELSMRLAGAVPQVMTLLDNRPLRLLDRLRKDRDFVTGEAEALVTVALPLRPGNAPADIDWSVEASLRDVRTEDIVRGRVLAAETLRLRALPELLEIAGTASLDGVPFTGRWQQALPPRGTDPIDPEAPPPPPRPLPEPGRVTGEVRLTPDGLDRLGIDLSALGLRGATDAEISILLPQGAPPQVQLTSDLRGMALSLPAISWTKGADSAADLQVAAVLDDVARIDRVALTAPGLGASGRIDLRPGGGLDRAVLDRVDTGWFAGPVTLVGRGAGSAPAVEINGGQADLRRALLNQAASGGGTGGSSPLTLRLDRLTITEGIALTDLRARLRGAAGEFTARVNGAATIEGVLAPQQGGAVVQIRAANAGAVLQSAGLFRDAADGSLSLTLRPTGRAGVYDGALRMGGLRVRNASALASLLQALSVVGILEQLGGAGLTFETVESDFTLRPGDILVRRASAVGPSLSITAQGSYDIGPRTLDMEGVVSPIYLVNGLFGALFSRRDEGLFGFTYQLRGPVDAPDVSVNPLSILTPGVFREIFRRPPPEG